MSRAFVKEDAEPAQIQWRKTSPSAEGARLPLTLSGASRLKDELARLKAGETNAKNAQRTAQLESALARSEIVDVRTLAGAQIGFGATVLLQDIEATTTAKYQIVGEIEAEPKLGRISIASPLARALIGREAGELVQLQAPKGGREYEVIALLWVEEAG